MTEVQMEKRIISFNEELHRYTDEHNVVYSSVTQTIGKVEPEFPDVFWAVYRAIEQIAYYKPRPLLEKNMINILWNGKRQDFTIPLLLSGVIPTIKLPQEVKKEWREITEEACQWGTDKHGYLELCINAFSKTTGYTIDYIKKEYTNVSNSVEKTFAFKVTNLDELERSPLRYSYSDIYDCLYNYVSKGWTVFAEKRVYSAYHKIAGTIDVLLVKNGHFIILDWKTNRKPMSAESGYYKKVWNADRSKKVETGEWVSNDTRFLAPLQHLQHCKTNIYGMQLSLYSLLCEMWGLKCHGILLCHIKPKCNIQGEILYNSDGSRIEEKPLFYNMKYLKDEAWTLAEWNRKGLI